MSDNRGGYVSNRREFERANILTLSDGTIWRYANVGNTWECITGALHGRFAGSPVLADRAPLTAVDAFNVQRVKYISRLCTMMSLDQARDDWENRCLPPRRGRPE